MEDRVVATENIIEIGMPGRFDPIFGLAKFPHDIIEFIYIIVWKDTGSQVHVGGFLDPLQAEDYVVLHRDDLIRSKMEEILL